MKTAKCPICGNNQFRVPVHIVQEYYIGSFTEDGDYGNYDYHGCEPPNENDIVKDVSPKDVWTCCECGYAATGKSMIGSKRGHLDFCVSEWDRKNCNPLEALRRAVCDFGELGEPEHSDENLVFKPDWGCTYQVTPAILAEIKKTGRVKLVPKAEAEES